MINNNQNRKKTICFACTTEFHLFISFVLSTTIYQNEDKIILCSNEKRILLYKKQILNSKIWKQKIFINNNKISQSQKILKQLSRKINVLHFFSFNNPLFNNFLKKCNHHLTKIILTYEGVSTYDPHERWPIGLSDMPKKYQILAKDEFEKAKEIWLLNPKLFCETSHKPIIQIDLQNFINTLKKDSKIAQEYISLFPIKKNLPNHYNYLYFHQSLSLTNKTSVSAENFIDELINKIFYNNHLYIKNHPIALKKQISEKYPNLPWIAILIYLKIYKPNQKTPKAFISPSSSAMFNICEVESGNDYIFLNKIFEKYTDYIDKTTPKLIKKCQIIYPKSHFYQPKNWSELISITAQINKRRHLKAPRITINEIDTLEQEWLQKEYIFLQKKQKIIQKLYFKFYPETTTKNISPEDTTKIINKILIDNEELKKIKDSKFFKLWLIYIKIKKIIFK